MRRIRRDEGHEEFIKELTSNENGVFKDLWRVLLFAALLGYRGGKRIPLGKYDSGKAMPESYFANTPAWRGTLYLMGLVETNSTAVLSSKPEDEDALLQVFEEYANGGLHMMRERLSQGQDKLKTILDIFDEFATAPASVVPDLKAVTI